MTIAGTAAEANPAWSDACRAGELFAVDPAGTGGVVVRALAGPVRTLWLSAVRAVLPGDAPLRPVPVGIADDRLLGGLDLSATLKRGAPVAESGVLVEADGGVIEVRMAERQEASTIARICAAMDRGEVVAERDGLSLRARSRFAVVALDEGMDDEEHVAASLADRLAFHVFLDGIRPGDARAALDRPRIADARSRLSAVHADDDVSASLCAAALALGIASVRAPILALRVARAAAALGGRSVVSAEDAALAARLVLAHRATRLPATEEESTEPPPEDRPQGDAPEDDERDAEPDRQAGELEDVVLNAAKAAVPADLLEGMIDAARPGNLLRSSGRAESAKRPGGRGRAVGILKGAPRPGVRLSIVDTLRAAAPWQRLRRGPDDVAGTRRVYVRPEDFRLVRRNERTQTTIIFAVDASGSAALHRLAEVKGAVELLLADCYVRRDQVALVAFRKQGAELLLPPTRSLVRAKRCLAGLPGGGATPLAAGIDSAVLLALAERRKGRLPRLVLMTDGRANIGRDGEQGRTRADQDALSAARSARAAGIPALVIDTSPRTSERARGLADEMAARYLPLPYANAHALTNAIQADGH